MKGAIEVVTAYISAVFGYHAKLREQALIVFSGEEKAPSLGPVDSERLA
ncbi:hypothetical protein N9R27_00710 [Flavobacteriaceae bacterium]|nr:hypothetical protein [Flavobacteriaceae bacterium]